jgi:phage terminase large subunit-like protein
LNARPDPPVREDDQYIAEIDRLLREMVRVCGGDDRLLRHFLRALPPPVLRGLIELWSWQAHGGQKVPAGDWAVWLLMAGRGFGKTLAGAEWVSARARETPDARIALVGSSRDDVVKVMIDGKSGIRALARVGEHFDWKPTLGTLRFGSGAMAFIYSAEAPEGLRGPEHHFAWADELAKWRGRGADATWDNLMLGMRLGPNPQVVVTTTPRPVRLLKRVLALDRLKVTGGATDENVHLPDAFIGWMRSTYGGTRLGRQELGGELIEDAEGALFTREVLDKARTASAQDFTRVVVGVDPPASESGTCGIVVCASGADSTLSVLADASIGGASPERWARCVAAAAEAWGADRVIAEKNQGGDMVASVLRNADVHLPVKLVSASRGKSARAEPVAILFESGRAKLAGRFPALEDELAGLMIGGGYCGPGHSPDRADACVWAMTALMRTTPEPRIALI